MAQFIRSFISPQAYSAKHAPYFALIISLGLLIGAWIFQYGLGYAPCQMCYWQRHAHKAVIILSLIGIFIPFFKQGERRLINGPIITALWISAGLAMWHMGVEYKWWEGPKSCLAANIDLSTLPNGTDILSALNDPIKAPGCDKVVWSLLGLSMAGWNFLVSSLASLVMLALMLRVHKN